MTTASDNPARRPRVLMLTHRVPYPPDRGDRIRSDRLLRELARRADVSLACLSDEPVTAAQRTHLADLTMRLEIAPLNSLACRARGGVALATGRAITPAWFTRPGLARTIRRWHADQPFDAALAFCTSTADYLRHLPGVPAVLDLVDVDSAKWAEYASQTRGLKRWIYAAEARRLVRVEKGDGFRSVAVISEPEAAVYRERVGSYRELVVAGNGVDLDRFRPSPDPGEPVAVFTGLLSYRPNAEACQWLVERVWPGVREKFPAARLRLVGRGAGPELEALAGVPGVELVGEVEDVAGELAAAAVAVAPLRIARGVQNKVLEAMAAGRPVLCTPQALEGIDAAPGRDLLVAEAAADWVHRLAELLSDAGLRRRFADAGRSRVESRYDWSAALAPLVDAVLGAGRGAADD
ncbi:MAG: TIGR03087 family PEP-CTERM/XrtA system glycosyltransferase [Phycisphaeraceae bacterium]